MEVSASKIQCNVLKLFWFFGRTSPAVRVIVALDLT